MKHIICCLTLLLAFSNNAFARGEQTSYSTIPELQTYYSDDVIHDTRKLRQLSEKKFKNELARQNEINRLANPHLQNQNSGVNVFPKFEMPFTSSNNK